MFLDSSHIGILTPRKKTVRSIHRLVNVNLLVRCKVWIENIVSCLKIQKKKEIVRTELTCPKYSLIFMFSFLYSNTYY